MKKHVHNFLSIFVMVFPPVLFLAQLVGEMFMTLPQREWLMQENGPHEVMEFFVLAIAAVVAAATLIRMDRARDRLLTAWVALALLCCIYVGGEEISWGQWIFHWGTPDSWAQINDQHETNLHNTSAWLDQKPRLILEIGIIIGGILLPLYRRFRPEGLPARFALFYPPNTLIPLALCAEGVKLLQSTCNGLGSCAPFYRSSEVQELFFFLFVLCYLLVLRARIKARDTTASVPSDQTAH